MSDLLGPDSVEALRPSPFGMLAFQITQTDQERLADSVDPGREAFECRVDSGRYGPCGGGADTR